MFRSTYRCGFAVLLSLVALAPSARAQAVRTYDAFSSAAPDPALWEPITEAGSGTATARIQSLPGSDGALVISGPAGEARGGLASRARLGSRFAVEADGLGYEGTNQILQVYGGDGGFSQFVEYGIEGTSPDGTPTLHVWPSAGPAWEGPAPRKGPYGPDRPLRLRVERDGRTFRFFCDGTLVHTLATDSVGGEARIVLYGFGASTSRWDNVALSGPEVRITAPGPNASLTGAADVSGTAGPDTRAWRLEAGSGASPARWTRIAEGKGPVSGRLGRWVPPADLAGEATLRLVATGADGTERAYWSPVRLDRAVIGQPRAGQVVGPAFTVTVRGDVRGAKAARFLDNGRLKAVSSTPPFYARLTPSADGAHALTVELSGADGAVQTIGPVRVTVRRGLYGGNARVCDAGGAFLFPDGHTGPIIGQNDSYTWDGLMPLWKRNDVAAVEEYIASQRQSGVNVLRVMLESAGGRDELLEDPLGTYNPQVVGFWDKFLALCEKHHMTVLLTPWDTFWMSQPWSRSPYNRANGGPCDAPSDFITSPAARRREKERLKFLIDRWGNSPAIFAIDLLNEHDIWWQPATPAERADWADEMARYVRDYELKRWGHAHMLTISSAAAEPRGVTADLVYRYPLFEFATTHLYYPGTVSDPQDLVGPARSVDHGVRYALSQIEDGRPYTDSESGPIDLRPPWLTGDGAFDDAYYAAMSWAHLASGGAGTGMRWPYRVPHILSPGMNRAEQSIAQVAGHLDWAAFRPENADGRLSTDRPGFVAMGSSDGRQALVWLLREDAPKKGQVGAAEDRKALAGAHLTLSGLRAGRYRATCWDTATGFPVSGATLTASGDRVTVALPPILYDLALTVRPAGEMP